ncbi:MAG: hypothetical protein ACRC1K_03850 [Planctomycetia bacterium]
MNLLFAIKMFHELSKSVTNHQHHAKPASPTISLSSAVFPATNERPIGLLNLATIVGNPTPGSSPFVRGRSTGGGVVFPGSCDATLGLTKRLDLRRPAGRDNRLQGLQCSRRKGST